MSFIGELQAKSNSLRGMYANAQSGLIEGITIARRSCSAPIAWHAMIFHIDLENSVMNLLKRLSAFFLAILF
ncbi:MAG: hypothetical protein AABM33_17960, partial [Pseudomonadota bacterium]